jgi:hypothetical protein
MLQHITTITACIPHLTDSTINLKKKKKMMMMMMRWVEQGSVDSIQDRVTEVTTTQRTTYDIPCGSADSSFDPNRPT